MTVNFSDNHSGFLNANLRTRVLSALVMAPLALGAVWLGGWVFALVVLAAMAISFWEWLGLTAPRFTLRGRVVAFAALAFVFLVAGLVDAGLAAALSIGVAVVLAFYDGEQGALTPRLTGNALWVALGIPYLALSGLSLILLRNDDSYGLASVVYLLVVVWGTDIGGYLAGRLIGGPKLLPQISPKKTWAGLIGGMALATVLGYACERGFGFHPTLSGILLAPALAVIAQAGDFFESWAKRRAGAKDSGTLIPGHGGLLDRIDGLLFAAMALAAFSFGD
ncbi:MAG: phosphatidate cytidylyltransferase [Bdellovibrionales bacterium]|jgi:phosphatidate cytidylyltransferase